MASYVAIFSLFFMIIGDAHAHRCLDGQEPELSVHFENLDVHPDHSGDKQPHNDYEYEIETDTLQIKFKDLNHYVLTSSSLAAFFTPDIQYYFTALPTASFINNDAFSIRPPLRAPPVIG